MTINMMTQEEFDKLISEFSSAIGRADVDWGRGDWIDKVNFIKVQIKTAYAEAQATIASQAKENATLRLSLAMAHELLRATHMLDKEEK